MWHDATTLTAQWVDDYSKVWSATSKEIVQTKVEEDQAVYSIIRPNSMQQVALENLTKLRDEGKRKGLVISATGTGKTYLSAFDVRNAEPTKMLFIVHREQILKSARDTFKKVLGGPDEDFGILSGNSKDISAKYLFATIQTISMQATLDSFLPDAFDYNIAYEIRLQEALEEDLLCPFHYFGVTDYENNGAVIEEGTRFNNLVAEDRVKFIIEKIKYYGVSQHKIKGLVFCSSKEEASTLSDMFNIRGFIPLIFQEMIRLNIEKV